MPADFGEEGGEDSHEIDGQQPPDEAKGGEVLLVEGRVLVVAVTGCPGTGGTTPPEEGQPVGLQ